MPRNVYLNPNVKSEQSMYEDIVIEALSMYGQETHYLPRDLTNFDDILGDASQSEFNRSYRLMMYIENTEGFDGEGDLFTKFGIELRDEATFIVARRSFHKWVSTQEQVDFYRPREGDLIYLELSKSLFEIVKVETESPFYQIGNLPVFKLRAQLYEANSDNFDTNIEDIDNLAEASNDYKVILELDSPSDSLDYKVGETITTTYVDDSTLSGEIIEWDSRNNLMTITHVNTSTRKFKMWAEGDTIIGNVNLTEATIKSVKEELAGGTSPSQNDTFSDIDFIDFTESNPFGDV